MEDVRKKIILSVTLEGSGKFEGSYERLITLQARLNRQFEVYKQRLADAAAGKTKVNVPALELMSNKLARLQRNLDLVNATMERHQMVLRQHAAAMVGGAEETKSLDDQVKSLGLGIGALIGAYYALDRSLGVVIRKFNEWEYTLTNVKTLLDEQFETLEQDSIDIMKRYGFAVKDVNKAYFDAISAMIPAAEATQFINEASRLAIGGVTDLTIAVDGLTSVVNAYQLEVSEAGRVADAFFRAQKFGKTTVEELVNDIGRVAPIAAIANVSYQEMLATLAELTLGGLDTRESVTILRQAIAGLIKPAAEAEEVLKEFNVPVGIAEVSTMGLTYSLGKLTEAAIAYPDAIANMIPNIRAFTGVAALTGERLEHLKYITEDVMHNFGEGSSLTEAYNEQMETLNIHYKIWNESINAFLIQFGSRLKPALIWLMDNTKILVGTLGAVFAGFIAFRAVVITTTIATAAFNKVLAVTRAALNSLTGIIGIIAGALTLATTAILAFRSNIVGGVRDNREFAESQASIIRETKQLFDILKKGNKDTQEYKDALKEVNEKYKDYLDYQITDKTTTEQLSIQKNILNNKLIEELALRQQIAEIEKLKEDKLADYSEGRAGVRGVLFKEVPSNQSNITADEMNKIVELEQIFANKIEQIAKKRQDDELSWWKTRQEISKIFWDDELKNSGLSADAQGLISDHIYESVKALAEFNREAEATNKYFDAIKNKAEESLNVLLNEVPEGDFAYHKYTMDAVLVDFQKKLDVMSGMTDEYKKSLYEAYTEQIKIYIDMRTRYEEEMRSVSQTGAAVPEWLSNFKKEVEEQNLAVVKAYKEYFESVDGEMKKLIDMYNFYLHKDLGYKEKLSRSQINELNEAIKKYNAEQEKEMRRYEEARRSALIEIQDAEVDSMKDGVEKQLAEQKIAHQKRLLQIQRANDKELDKINELVIKRQLLEKDAAIRRKEANNERIALEEAAEIAHQNNMYRIMLAYGRKVEDFMLNRFSKLDSQMQAMLRAYDIAIKEIERKRMDDKDYSGAMFDTEKMELTLKLNRDMFDAIQAMRDKYNIETSRSMDAAMENELTILNENQLAVEAIYDINFKKLKKLHDDGLLNEETYNNKVKQLENKRFADLKAFNQAKEKLNVEHEKKIADLKKGFGIDQQQQYYNYELANLKVALQNDLITREEYYIALNKLKRKYNVSGANWRTSEQPGTEEADVPTQEQVEIREYARDRSFEIAKQVSDEIFAMKAEADAAEFERRREALESQYEMEYDLLKNALDKGALTEEQYAKKKTELDKKKLEEERKLKREQWEKQRKADLLQIIINGLIGASQALATYPMPLGAVMAALTIAAAGVFAGLLMSKKNPYKLGGLAWGKKRKYGDGGYQDVAEFFGKKIMMGKVGGKPHSQGGTSFYGTDGSAFEAERDEIIAIVNKRDSETLASLSSLNSRHGKSYFRDGGVFGTESITAPRDFTDKQMMFAFDAIRVFAENVRLAVNVDEITDKQETLNKVRDGVRW